MPSGFSALDTSFPDLQGRDTEEALQIVTDYLYQLLEQLRYMLHNLGTKNFNQTELEAFASSISTPIHIALQEEIDRAEGAEATLQTNISIEAGRITSEVTRATTAEGALGTRITQTEEAITAEVNRATAEEGTLSSRITQTAADITSEVSRASAAEGVLQSSITQNASAITAEVSRATGAESAIQQSADAIKAQVTDGQGNYTVLNLKSDGLHIGSAAGLTTIDGGNITANSITLSRLGSDVTGSFGDANPAYIKNTYIDFRQVVSPAVYAGDFYGALYHDINGNTILYPDYSSGVLGIMFGKWNNTTKQLTQELFRTEAWAEVNGLEYYGRIDLMGKVFVETTRLNTGVEDGFNFPYRSFLGGGVQISMLADINCPIILDSNSYGSSLPGGGTTAPNWSAAEKAANTGRLFFKI